MSAYPLVVKKQLEARKLKMAMALTGKRRHYEWTHILHRHWLATAKSCRFPTDEMAAVIDDVLERMDDVINQVSAQLQATFPDAVAGPIFDGMRSAREKLARSTAGE
jgi:serine/threonine-protein kinase HipA